MQCYYSEVMHLDLGKNVRVLFRYYKPLQWSEL